jgi:hypothetical protein
MESWRADFLETDGGDLLAVSVRAWLDGSISWSEFLLGVDAWWDIATDPWALASVQLLSVDLSPLSSMLLQLAASGWASRFPARSLVSLQVAAAADLVAGRKRPLRLPVVRRPTDVAAADPSWRAVDRALAFAISAARPWSDEARAAVEVYGALDALAASLSADALTNSLRILGAPPRLRFTASSALRTYVERR